MIDLFGHRRIAKLTRELDDAKREIRRKDGIIERNCDLIKMYSEELAEKLDENARLTHIEKLAEREALAKLFISKQIGPVSTRHVEDAYRFADEWIAVRDAAK